MLLNCWRRVALSSVVFSFVSVYGNKRIKPDETTLDIPSSIKTVVQLCPQSASCAKKTTYAAIDAWIPGIGAFQMTVGKKHDIKGGARDDLAMLGGANRLYWLLPPLYYHSLPRNHLKILSNMRF